RCGFGGDSACGRVFPSPRSLTPWKTIDRLRADSNGEGSARELLVVLSRLDLLRRLLGGLSLDGHAHGHARADDLEHAGLQRLPLHRVRLHVRDLDRLRKREIPDARLPRLSRALL